MRRRTKTVRSAKTRLRRSTKQKRRHGSVAQRQRVPRNFGRETEIEPLTRELNTIAEQQRPTTEVLKLISSSFGDPQPLGSARVDCLPRMALLERAGAQYKISKIKFAISVMVSPRLQRALRLRSLRGELEPSRS